MPRKKLDPVLPYRSNPGDKDRIDSLRPLVQRVDEDVIWTNSDVYRLALKRGLDALVSEYVGGEG